MLEYVLFIRTYPVPVADSKTLSWHFSAFKLYLPSLADYAAFTTVSMQHKLSPPSLHCHLQAPAGTYLKPLPPALKVEIYIMTNTLHYKVECHLCFDTLSSSSQTHRACWPLSDRMLLLHSIQPPYLTWPDLLVPHMNLNKQPAVSSGVQSCFIYAA